MKSTLLKLALGAALGIASTLALADRDHGDRDRREYRDHDRGDYRVEGPRRWDDRHGHYRHFNHRPHWNHHRKHHWKHHVHDRWCDHQPPAVRYGPRYLGPRHSGFGGGHHYNDSGITLIIRGDLN